MAWIFLYAIGAIMAFSEYPTRLSIDRFAAIIGIPLWHFSQLQTPQALKDASGRDLGCSQVIYQHRYQSPVGVPGRNDIGRAIYEAEKMIERELHFDLLRTWNSKEQIPTGRYGQRYGQRYGHPLKLLRSYYIEPAVMVSTLVEDDVSIDEEDLDGDDYAETATVVVTIDAPTAAAVISDEEFRVYYPGKSGDPLWEIRPVAVTRVGTEVTIRFSVSQLVDPAIVERMIPLPLDPDEAGNFIDTVDVYWVRSDTAIGSALSLTCKNCDGTLTSLSTTSFNVWAEDKVGSVIRVLSGGACGCVGACGCWAPIETLSYAAGWPGSTYTRMDPHFEAAVVALAMSQLGSICSCSDILGYKDYGKDLSLIGHSEAQGGGGTHDRWATRPPAFVMKNPWGTSLGEVTAWGIIVNDIVGETMNDYNRVPPTPIPVYNFGSRLW